MGEPAAYAKAALSSASNCAFGPRPPLMIGGDDVPSP